MTTLRAVVLVELLPLKMLLWVSSQEGTSYSTRDHDININIQCEYIYIHIILYLEDHFSMLHVNIARTLWEPTTNMSLKF
jgi:hypothetical protein